MTASVPLRAPPTPPLTGAVDGRDPLVPSAAATAADHARPVVDRSMKVFMRVPAATPTLADRDGANDVGRRQAHEHGLDRVRNLARRASARAPRAASGASRRCARVIDGER